MKFETVSIQTVYQEWLRKQPTGYKDNEEITLNIMNQCLNTIIPADNYEHRLAFIDINKTVGDLPKGFFKVIQALYNTKEKCPGKWIVTDWIKDLPQSGCHLDIKLKCPDCKQDKCQCPHKTLKITLDSREDDDYPEIMSYYQNMFFGGASTQQLSPFHTSNPHMKHYGRLTPALNNYFNHQYTLNLCNPALIETTHEYRLYPPKIEVNFPKGHVLMSYLSYPVDSGGDFLVPDNPAVLQCLFNYIDCEYAYMDYKMVKDNANLNFYRLAEERKNKSLGYARYELDSISFEEFDIIVQNFYKKVIEYSDHWTKLDAVVPDYFDFKQ